MLAAWQLFFNAQPPDSPPASLLTKPTRPPPPLPRRGLPAVHPELSSPLRKGSASHHQAALYAGLVTLGQVLRTASHPASWAEPPGSVWDALAASAGLDMRPQLVLLLSSLLPVEARLSYLALRHAAYAGPGGWPVG